MLKTRHREERLLQLCLETQQPFVIDNTNATIANRVRHIQPAKCAGYRIIGYFFEPDIPEALKRNELRQGRERIPKVGIFATLKRLQHPLFSERIRRTLFSVKSSADGFLIEKWPGNASHLSASSSARLLASPKANLPSAKAQWVPTT